MENTTIIAVIATFFGGLGALFLKKGSGKLKLSIRDCLKNTNLMLGITFYIISIVIMLFAYRFSKLSYIYPLVSLSYIWVALFSYFLLKEKLNKYKWLGILLIMAGVILINLSG